MLEKSCENIFFFGGRPGGAIFICVVVLLLKHVLENKGLVFGNNKHVVYFCPFCGVVLVLKHMLDNKDFMLDLFFGVFFLRCRPCSQACA